MARTRLGISLQEALRGCRGAEGQRGVRGGGTVRGGGVTGHRLLPGQSAAEPGDSRTEADWAQRVRRRLRHSPNRTHSPNRVNSTQVRPLRVPAASPPLGPSRSYGQSARRRRRRSSRGKSAAAWRRTTARNGWVVAVTHGPVRVVSDRIGLERIPPRVSGNKSFNGD